MNRDHNSREFEKKYVQIRQCAFMHTLLCIKCIFTLVTAGVRAGDLPLSGSNIRSGCTIHSIVYLSSP